MDEQNQASELIFALAGATPLRDGVPPVQHLLNHSPELLAQQHFTISSLVLSTFSDYFLPSTEIYSFLQLSSHGSQNLCIPTVQAVARSSKSLH